MAIAGSGQGDEPTGTSAYNQAAAALRSTAQWLITAFAAIAGVLVAGVPLTGIGRIKVGTNEFYAAIGGLALALLAIAYIIRQVAKVLTNEYVNLTGLALEEMQRRQGPGQTSPVVHSIELSREELFGDVAETLADLHRQLALANEHSRLMTRKESIPSSAKKKNERKAEEADTDQKKADRAESVRIAERVVDLLRTIMTSRDSIAQEAMRNDTSEAEEEVDIAYGAADRVRIAAQRVVDFANYEVARLTFQRLYRRMVAAGAIVGFGVVLFAYQTSQASTPAITSPLQVIVTLNADAAKRLRSQLGPSCDPSRIEAVTVGGDLNEPEVVTKQTANCNAVRFKVSANAGVAVPIPTTAPTSTTISKQP
jgi:hypothetical protein